MQLLLVGLVGRLKHCMVGDNVVNGDYLFGKVFNLRYC